MHYRTCYGAHAYCCPVACGGLPAVFSFSLAVGGDNSSVYLCDYSVTNEGIESVAKESIYLGKCKCGLCCEKVYHLLVVVVKLAMMSRQTPGVLLGYRKELVIKTLNVLALLGIKQREHGAAAKRSSSSEVARLILTSVACGPEHLELGVGKADDGGLTVLLPHIEGILSYSCIAILFSCLLPKLGIETFT